LKEKKTFELSANLGPALHLRGELTFVSANYLQNRTEPSCTTCAGGSNL